MKYCTRTLQAHEETRWTGIDILQHKILETFTNHMFMWSKNWRKLHNEGFQNFYPSYYCIKNQDVE